MKTLYFVCASVHLCTGTACVFTAVSSSSDTNISLIPWPDLISLKSCMYNVAVMKDDLSFMTIYM